MQAMNTTKRRQHLKDEPVSEESSIIRLSLSSLSTPISFNSPELQLLATIPPSSIDEGALRCVTEHTFAVLSAGEDQIPTVKAGI